MTGRPEFPSPMPSEEAAPFWEHLRAGELRLQRCQDCAAFTHPPRLVCASCGATGREWAAVSGRGTVYSYVVTHQAVHPAFEGHTPYATVVVELEEGPLLTSNLVDVPIEDVSIGMPVELALVEVGDGVTLPLFRRR
ncbi:MAG: Zn-ribbon domain-containing OB-fold protein [Dehalococcoidia bacterium]